MLGPLRRLITGRVAEGQGRPSPSPPQVPWYLREEGVSAESLEVARQRLKQTVRPPDEEDPEPPS